MSFSRAIVRRPGRSFINGLTTANLGLPSYDLALSQHSAYVDALKNCGLDVSILPADERFPDSTFVEDTALLTPKCAIIMRPGAQSRRGEPEAMAPTIREFFPSVHQLAAPGTADAGDIMAVGPHYFIGLSERTNREGARQIIEIVQSYGMSGSTIDVGAGLHLKSSMSYLEDGNLLVTSAFTSHPALSHLNRAVIPDNEQYAANSLWLNGTALVPTGFPGTEKIIQSLGYKTVLIDVSEFRKLDGGLSCLSLRF